MSHRLLLAAAVAASALATVPTVAGAAVRETQTTITGWTKAPGPRTYDRLAVTRFGPAAAKTVLVLVPGTNGGGGGLPPAPRGPAARRAGPPGRAGRPRPPAAG